MIRQDWRVLELGLVEEERPRQQEEGEGRRKMADRLLLLLLLAVSVWVCGVTDVKPREHQRLRVYHARLQRGRP